MKLARLILSSSKVRFLMTGMTMMFLLQPLLSSVASASPQQPKPKIFETWCRQRKSVPAATRYTIDILLEKAGTKDCQKADRQLKTLTNLDLSGNKISDVNPLAGLTNLTSVDLTMNKISDIKPLAGLTNLTSLSLNGNKISDVKPLAGLINLTTLDLNENKISDVKSLAGLINLTTLLLMGNQISDVKPLAGLTGLGYFELFENPIAVKVCPVKPASICRF